MLDHYSRHVLVILACRVLFRCGVRERAKLFANMIGYILTFRVVEGPSRPFRVPLVYLGCPTPVLVSLKKGKKENRSTLKRHPICSRHDSLGESLPRGLLTKEESLVRKTAATCQKHLFFFRAENRGQQGRSKLFTLLCGERPSEPLNISNLGMTVPSQCFQIPQYRSVFL